MDNVNSGNRSGKHHLLGAKMLNYLESHKRIMLRTNRMKPEKMKNLPIIELLLRPGI